MKCMRDCRSMALLAMVVGLMIVGCQQRVVQPEAPPRPPRTYTGPEFFRGTIRSLSSLRGYQPLVVQGYGLVVNLNETGSGDVPPMLRQWLINEMSKGGFGKTSLGYGHLTPDQVLNSNRTAVVLVEAIIPPGAIKGSTCDVAVAALPGTQTTSLEGGLLYTTQLSFRGANLTAAQSRPFVEARGPIFVNPFVTEADQAGMEGRPDDPRIGRVLGGGTVLVDMPMSIALNQPSYAQSRRVTDRINGRFPPSQADKFPIATAVSPEQINLNVTEQFEDNPRRMLDLIAHLYLNPSEKFTQETALKLADALNDPTHTRHADQIALAWEGMGRRILPILRNLYSDANPTRQLAALSAGAHLGDMRATDPLLAIASKAEPGRGEQAAELLGVLLERHPDNFRLRALLRQLIDSDDAFIRLEALYALARTEDPVVVRRNFSDGRTLKMELILARSDRPMIYVSRTQTPRIVVFGQTLGFNDPLFLSMWDNHLMLRGSADQPRVRVYFKPFSGGGSETEQIAPTLGNLTYLLANQPDPDRREVGFDLPYSRIVRVLYELSRQNMVDAPMVLQPSDLIEQIARQKQMQDAAARPETATTIER